MDILNSGSDSELEHGASTDLVSSGCQHHPDKKQAWQSLVFADETQAYKFYAQYGKSRGFSIRFAGCNKRTRKSDGVQYIRYIYLTCNRQGQKNEDKNPGVVCSHKRADIRIGCKAALKLHMDFARNGYVIHHWSDVHSHDFVDLDKVNLLPTSRKIQPAQKQIIDMHIASGVSQRSTYDIILQTHGGHENVQFTRGDMKNYVGQSKRRDTSNEYIGETIIREMAPGEGVLMQKWFRDQALSKPGFFYDFEVDENNEITSIFWADAVMVADYAKFGDFLSFDTTYRTNKESRPLGIFCGFNHHKGTCVFGGALLYDEKTLSFKWLFETFLKCMNDKRPTTLMTDQAPAIAAAIRVVFPGVFHALCSWHIYQNAMKRCGSLATSEFSEEFNHLIKHVDNEAEFEYGWKQMMLRCFENCSPKIKGWLDYIYSFKRQWSAAWVKSQFTAGKTTTQLSEQLNAFTRFYLGKDLSIVQMLRRFQSLTDDLRHNEKQSDYYMQSTNVKNNFKRSSIMCHASTVFTPTVFKIIHDEFDVGMGYTFKEQPQDPNSTSKVAIVQRWENMGLGNKQLVEEEMVEINSEEHILKCSCRFFENWWLLCRHILRVMETYSALGNEFCFAIPDAYIIGRWTRSYKKSCTDAFIQNIGHAEPVNYGQRYQRLCHMMTGVGSRICYNELAYSLFMNKVIDAAKEAEVIFQSSVNISAPSRSECSSSTGDDDVFVAKKLKQRHKDSEPPNTVRLMSNLETRHLIWKLQRKKEMKLLEESKNRSSI